MNLASPDRVEAVWQLLRSYADWEPGLTTWTGSVVRTSGAVGEAAGVRVPCPHCDSTGRAGRTSCRFCKGSGVIWQDPQTGADVAAPAPGDDFRFSPRDAELAIRRRRVRCDTCGGSGARTASSALNPQGDHQRCHACAGTGRVEVIDERATDASLARTERDWGTATHDPGWWLPAALERKQHQWVRGSYPELEQLLLRLDLQSPVARRMVDRFVIHDDGTVLDPGQKRRLDAVVLWLAERMPHPIRVPDEAKRVSHAARESLWRGRTDAHDERRQERDVMILRRHADGESPGSIAASFGLTRRRVTQIVASAAGETALVASGPAA